MFRFGVVIIVVARESLITGAILNCGASVKIDDSVFTTNEMLLVQEIGQ
jgi:hypothetical protein